MVVSSPGFLFSPNIPDVELKEAATQKHQQMCISKSPNKCLLSLSNGLGKGPPSKIGTFKQQLFNFSQNTTEKTMTSTHIAPYQPGSNVKPRLSPLLYWNQALQASKPIRENQARAKTSSLSATSSTLSTYSNCGNLFESLEFEKNKKNLLKMFKEIKFHPRMLYSANIIFA